jgi:hypothetical protein
VRKATWQNGLLFKCAYVSWESERYVRQTFPFVCNNNCKNHFLRDLFSLGLHIHPGESIGGIYETQAPYNIRKWCFPQSPSSGGFSFLWVCHRRKKRRWLCRSVEMFVINRRPCCGCQILFARCMGPATSGWNPILCNVQYFIHLPTWGPFMARFCISWLGNLAACRQPASALTGGLGTGWVSGFRRGGCLGRWP